MHDITTLQDLEALYGKAVGTAVTKVTNMLTPLQAKWISRSNFCVLTTVGPEGTDGSPRGDEGAVVRILDAHHVVLPDWHGNNRVDSLRNIVVDGRVSIMFLVAGSNNAMRINGKARISVDPDLVASFSRQKKKPRSVIIVEVGEVYPQCARALLRSDLWSTGDQSEGLPTVGDLMREVTNGVFDGDTYDQEWSARASKTLW